MVESCSASGITSTQNSTIGVTTRGAVDVDSAVDMGSAVTVLGILVVVLLTVVIVGGIFSIWRYLHTFAVIPCGNFLIALCLCRVKRVDVCSRVLTTMRTRVKHTFLNPEFGSQNATLVVVVINSVKSPRLSEYTEECNQNFAYTFPTYLPSHILN